MIPCKLCNRGVPDGINLSDGSMIHELCLSSLEDKATKINKQLEELQSKLFQLERELQRREGIGFKIVAIFSKPKYDSAAITRAILDSNDRISTLSNDLSAIRAKLTLLYDCFLTYPPDWDERKKEVIRRDGEICSTCGSRQLLHLHHITPLSRGGTNRTSNLQLLCEDCHSEKHGGKDFVGEFSHSETAFSKRVSNIRYAIQRGKRVKFGYKKLGENGYKNRTIQPLGLVNFDHRRDNGSTLCVLGFCELRKANRNFALKRMRGLKVI